MNKLSLTGSCQQVVMINLSAIKSHVKETFRLFQNTNRKTIQPFHSHLSYIPKYALLCFLNSREFRKPQRRHRGQRRLKNEFIFYLRISQYSQVIYFVYHCRNYRKNKSGTQR